MLRRRDTQTNEHFLRWLSEIQNPRCALQLCCQRSCSLQDWVQNCTAVEGVSYQIHVYLLEVSTIPRAYFRRCFD